MTAHTILRLFVYALGLYAAYNGLHQGVYYLSFSLNTGVSFFSGDALAFAVVPLALAAGCLGFGRRIVRFLLGAEARLPEPLVIGDVATAAPVFLKILGVVLFASYIGPGVATIYELIALKAGRAALDESKVLADLISNALGLAAAVVLVTRTHKVLVYFKAQA